jgi:WD40 repeat protein
MSRFLQFSIFSALASSASLFAAPADDSAAPVSYFRHIRPIFQAHCNGCHQPAKMKSGYLMTDFVRMTEGGDDAKESGKRAVVAGKPDESTLLAQIIPKDGVAEMPPKKAPLAAKDIERIRRWIAEGAKNDTPENARQKIDAAHPPIYQRPPVIASLDFSPDGTLLAVAGFHEVILWKGDGSEIVARLVGLGERVQAVRFSPDGKFVATAGGQPSEFGEIQVWDVEKRSLLLSSMHGGDTIYGVNWSPDGKLISFGGPDKTVRAIESATGRQVVQQTSHDDWVIDTTFTHKGDNLVSVGRDMTAKLTEVATQRFVDNITSITPGALRGGIHSVARHPVRDEFAMGSSDGVPSVYRLQRKTQRRIGDNALCVRKWPAMEGRIYAVHFAPDGKSFAAASSLDGSGAVHRYNYDFNTEMPDEFVKIEGKDFGARSDDEKKRLDDHYHSDVRQMAAAKFPGGIYALRYKPDGSVLAVAGEDGKVRLLKPDDLSILKEFVPVPLK